MSSKKKVVFISSTGGHLAELLQLEPLYNRFDSYIITEKMPINNWLREKYKTYFLIYGARNYILRYIVKFTINIFISLILYFKIRPDFIISTGAHTSVPLCYIGKLFGTKIIFLETFAKINHPSITGKLVYRIADRFYIQWKPLKSYYPKAIYKGGVF